MTRAARINALARLSGARRYLEVGVCFGETFFEVDVRYKVAVDPLFRFDYKEKEDKLTRFFPVTSDAYFEASTEAPFDIIYLDGLHTYDQTTRDFMNSARLSHDKTIWMIVDTVPIDVFSADPDQERCYRLRKMAGGDDWSWMGDVYKTVFFIDRTLPHFDFRTFSGHGQTVVWRSARPRNTPGALSLERIGIMTYEDMVEHQGAMRVDTDANIYRAVETR